VDFPNPLVAVGYGQERGFPAAIRHTNDASATATIRIEAKSVSGDAVASVELTRKR
jgi:hypothetical protein